MDITNALAPKSDQLDAVDLLGSPPQVFTITDVSEGNAEQPVNIQLAEFPRVWRPSKGMLRVMAHCWGKQTKPWAGRQVELYTDPDVMFGNIRVGGIRISRLSHIDKRTSVPMIIKRGQGGSWSVDPLPESAPTASEAPTEAPIIAAFARGGVTQEQLEARIGRTADAWTPDDVATLGTLFAALKSGETTKDAEFPAPAPEMSPRSIKATRCHS